MYLSLFAGLPSLMKLGEPGLVICAHMTETEAERLQNAMPRASLFRTNQVEAVTLPFDGHRMPCVQIILPREGVTSFTCATAYYDAVQVLHPGTLTVCMEGPRNHTDPFGGRPEYACLTDIRVTDRDCTAVFFEGRYIIPCGVPKPTGPVSPAAPIPDVDIWALLRQRRNGVEGKR